MPDGQNDRGKVLLSLKEASDLIRKGELSPVDLTQSIIKRIERIDPLIESFVSVTKDQALAAARQAEAEIHRGEYRGPLHGIPVALKDIFDVVGVPTTACSKVWRDNLPQSDCHAVRRLREAGAIIIGKTVTHEFQYGPISPPTKNPWRPDRIAGGSSGGSGAAVAAGLCYVALGADAGGSIRIPASICGVVGLKPTFGRVSKAGVTPLCWSLSCNGPMARTVEDIALALNRVAGYDPGDPSTLDEPIPDYTVGLSGGVEGMRIGLPTDYFFEDLDPEVSSRIRDATALLSKLGAEIADVNIRYVDYALPAWFGIIYAEVSEVFENILTKNGDLLSGDVKLLFQLGHLYLAKHYVRAQRARRLIKFAFRDAFKDVDAILAPTVPGPPPRVEEISLQYDRIGSPVSSDFQLSVLRLCAPINLVGLPSIAVPCGFSSDNLPVGMQLVGGPFEEGVIMRIASAYEKEAGWCNKIPPVLGRELENQFREGRITN